MAGFDDPDFYGDRWAEVYDERHAGLDPAAAVEFLAGLSGGGRVLELAIGTGRVALPPRSTSAPDAYQPYRQQPVFDNVPLFGMTERRQPARSSRSARGGGWYATSRSASRTAATFAHRRRSA